MNNRWRFPFVTGGQVTGQTTGDKEIFKRAPFASLAREIIQNSIDVCYDDSNPVRVQFRSFKMDTNKIPNKEGLKAQIERCIDFFHYDEDLCEKYNQMIQILEQDEVECLRISDFNTSGLIGVDSDDLEKNNFLALVKGTGISQKSSKNAGGSKGVGKNAPIVLSDLFLTWYTTLTIDNTKGSIGSASLVSGFTEEFPHNKNYFTQGLGFYSKDDGNHPINEIINLDDTFNRNEPGTDVYIIAFRTKDGWKQEIIESVIDSFLVAIYNKKLEVEVNDFLLNYYTLPNILNTKFTDRDKIYRSAISSYKMLSQQDNNVKIYDINTSAGSATLYVMPLKKDQEYYATHCCDMIRFPFMKIKELCRSQYLSFSALCIIDRNLLGTFLRKIENPEHNNWDPERLEAKLKVSYARAILKEITKQIDDAINDALEIKDDGKIDPNKAGQFLPEINPEGTGNHDSDSTDDKEDDHKSTIGKKRKNSPLSPIAVFDDPDDTSLIPNVGSIDSDNPGNTVLIEGGNDGKGSGPKNGEPVAANKDGDSIILQNIDKSPIKYKFIGIDPTNGTYKIIFISPVNHKKCYLKLGFIDLNNTVTPVIISELYCNGKEINITEENNSYGPFDIEVNEKIVLKVKTSNYKGNFGCEVKIICK